MSDVESTLTERGGRYGDFSDNSRIAQGIKRAMAQGSRYDEMPDTHRQALEVIADKMARICTGDPDYIDNWHDIQGYARLVEQRLEGAAPEPGVQVAGVYWHPHPVYKDEVLTVCLPLKAALPKIPEGWVIADKVLEVLDADSVLYSIVKRCCKNVHVSSCAEPQLHCKNCNHYYV